MRAFGPFSLHDLRIQKRGTRGDIEGSLAERFLAVLRYRAVEWKYGGQRSRDSEKGLRTQVAARSRKTKLATLEKADPSSATLPIMQAQDASSKNSMIAMACCISSADALWSLPSHRVVMALPRYFVADPAQCRNAKGFLDQRKRPER